MKAPLTPVLLLALPGPALAHQGGHEAANIANGFAHPLLGLDHLVVMVGVGVLAWRAGGWARWATPLAFVAMMAVGAGLTVAGIAVPAVEIGVATSLVSLVAAVLLLRIPPSITLTLAVGLFAVFHGAAHMAELPEGGSVASYMVGFLAATTLLHGAGIVSARLFEHLFHIRHRVLDGCK